MNIRLRGSLLIEAAVAMGVIFMGLGVVYLGFIQANRISLISGQTSLAMNALASQIDSDSRVSYTELTSAYPPPENITTLADASLERTVTENTNVQVKTVRYILEWTSNGIARTVHAEYEHVDKGLANE